MGIPGILKEIGKGERVALARLAVEHLERSKRPLRIAIDAAIWNFQTQAGQGGKNPALRTLFYRLVKLLALPIDPVFVYDGKNKPLTKRGRTVSHYGSCISNEMSKKLIQAFRFPYHTAPGEAEAECARLQSKGLVDAVMSQDVDAIMFGSTLTLRDWSKEASKHNKSPTHVNVLDLPRIKSLSGLDPDGMILVALLSGGDYDEAGVAGIGSTLACEIARAGFGSDLLELVRKCDEDGLREWRERLQFELETNESGYFKMKRKLVKVPDTFPDRKILEYYLKPAVTPDDELPKLVQTWTKAWESEVNIADMREYVRETFEWDYKPGAWKFVRVMAPALLANQLLRKSESAVGSTDQITERRKHFVSDGIPELRITMIPAEIVGLNLDAEEDSPEYRERLAAEEEAQDVAEEGDEENGENAPASPAKKRKTVPWLPDAPEKVWIAETIVEMGARDRLEEWRRIQEEIANDPKKFATRKCRKQNETRKGKNTTGRMAKGALLNYVVTAKPSSHAAVARKTRRDRSPSCAGDAAASREAPRTPTKPSSSRSGTLSSPTMRAFLQVSKSRDQTKIADDPLLEALVPPAEKNSMKEPIVIDSSPVHPAFEPTQEEPAALEVFSRSEEVPDTVTQRRNRKREKIFRTLVQPDPANGVCESVNNSPTRPKRKIESFFAPFISETQQKHTLAGDSSKGKPTDQIVVPPELTTGLKTNLSSRHVRALPRDSLPGTWKEVDGGATSKVALDPSRMSRPRVSIVDLTGD
ncbi:hypothetical protein LTR67_008019 [Exophiala xenobiotica]